jgi:hypothetical protein
VQTTRPTTPGQDLAETAGPVRDGAAADLAARDRKTGHAHGETTGTGLSHRLDDASPARLILHPPRACRAADAAALDGAGRLLRGAGCPSSNGRGVGLSYQPSVLRSAVAPVSLGADRVRSPRAPSGMNAQCRTRLQCIDIGAGQPVAFAVGAYGSLSGSAGSSREWDSRNRCGLGLGRARCRARHCPVCQYARRPGHTASGRVAGQSQCLSRKRWRLRDDRAGLSPGGAGHAGICSVHMRVYRRGDRHGSVAARGLSWVTRPGMRPWDATTGSRFSSRRADRCDAPRTSGGTRSC